MGKEKYEVELAANTKEAEKRVKQLTNDVKDLGKEAEKTGKKLDSGLQLGNEAVRALDRYTGGLASKLVKVGKAATLSGKAMKTALISTGIGALVVALGLVVQYWDDIKVLVNGVSSEQKDLLETTQKTLDVQEQQLKSTGQMENTLKLQGKSEKEIRDLKRQQTDEIITSTELLLEQQKSQKKAQVEAAERNKSITMGIITFLTAPIVMILGVIDALSAAMASLGIVDEATNLAEGYVEGVAEMLFNPEEVATAGDETINETENKLRQLKNTRDGYALQDKADAKKTADEKTQDEIQAEKDKAAALESIRKALIDTEAEERAEKLRKIGEDYDEQIRLAEEYYGKESEQVLALRAAQKSAIDTQQAEFDEQDAAKAQADLDYWANESDKRLKKLKEEKEEEARIEKEAAEYKENEFRNTYDDLQNVLSVGGKKMQKVSKALAIADVARTSFKSISATIAETGKANAAATAASPLTGGMPFVAINTAKAALSIGSTLASAKKSISSITADSKNPSGQRPASSGGGGGAASIPPAFNVVGASGTNQLADAIGGQTQQPTKAYVVASDVSTAQEMDRNIIEGASIG